MSDTDVALLARKQRVCSGHRSTITRLVNSVSAAVREDVVDVDQLLLNKQMLEEKLDVLKMLDNELADLVPDKELEEEIRVGDQYKENIYGALAKTDKALKAATTHATPTPVVAHPTSPAPVEHQSITDTYTVPLQIQQDPSWPPHLIWTESSFPKSLSHTSKGT